MACLVCTACLYAVDLRNLYTFSSGYWGNRGRIP